MTILPRCARRADEDRQLVELVDGLSAPQLAALVRATGGSSARAWKRSGQGTFCSLCSTTRPITAARHVLLAEADVLPPPLDVVSFLEEIGAAGPPGTLARPPTPERRRNRFVSFVTPSRPAGSIRLHVCRRTARAIGPDRARGAKPDRDEAMMRARQSRDPGKMWREKAPGAITILK
jgi:hypothetical protein